MTEKLNEFTLGDVSAPRANALFHRHQAENYRLLDAVKASPALLVPIVSRQVDELHALACQLEHELTSKVRATAPDCYESLGYALAMRVMQSDLFTQLDERERAECDELISRGLLKRDPLLEQKPIVLIGSPPVLGQHHEDPPDQRTSMSTRSAPAPAMVDAELVKRRDVLMSALAHAAEFAEKHGHRELERWLSHERAMLAALPVAAAAHPENVTSNVSLHPDDLRMIWYEDADKSPEIFYGAGAEAAADARFKSARDNWACHLLVHACPTGEPGHPLHGVDHSRPETPKSPCRCEGSCRWPCGSFEFCRRGHEREGHAIRDGR